MTPNRSALLLLLALTALAVWPSLATAFNGPFSSLVTVEPGVTLDVDVRWPDTGAPPPAGWPVVFLAHPAGGTKSTFGSLAGSFADDGYVTLTYTNRPGATSLTPDVFAADLTALKAWLLADFESEAAVTVPTDSASFGIFGQSLGGYVTWSGVLLTNLFAVAVPFNWSFHMFVDHVENNGSLERQTGTGIANMLSGEYPAAAVDLALEGSFGPTIANFPTVTIPVQNHLAMLDGRADGTHALTDHLALTSASNRMVYLGTGGHGTPNDDATFREDLRKRWFDHYLKGSTNGIETEDAIRLALLGTNEHLAYASWPPPGQNAVTLYLGAGGALETTAPATTGTSDAFDNDPGSLTWATAAPSFSVGNIRSQVVRDVIAYETTPLTEEVLVVGEASVELYVEGTGSRYQVNAHLFDVSPGGTPVTLAFASATTDTSPTTLDLDLSVTARRIPAGHQIRLEITNRDDQDVDPTNAFSPETDTLRYLPFFELSANQVFRDAARPSSLTLPLIGASSLPLAPAVPALSPGARALLSLALLGAGFGLHSSTTVLRPRRRQTLER